MISMKKRKQLLNLISEAFTEMLNDDEFSDPPEFWDNERKTRYDTINDVERRLGDKINKVISEWNLK